MFEALADVVNRLERIVFSLNANKPMEENEALVAEFFKTFKSVNEVFGGEYLDVRNFPTYFEMEDLLKCSSGFFVDWDPNIKAFIVRWDYERRIEFIRNGLQSLVWGLLGEALKYLPYGREALAQAYEDLLNGFGIQTDTETLEILHQLGLDKAKAYKDYMSVKQIFSREINALKRVDGLRQILTLVNGEGFSYKTRVKINDWWSTLHLFSQLDTALSNEFDTLAYQLISLNTLVKLEKLYRNKGAEAVQRILTPEKHRLKDFNFIDILVRKQLLTNLIGEKAVQTLKTNPTFIPTLKGHVEKCIMQTLQMLNTYVEKRLESCTKPELKAKRTKDPPFTVLYHTFFTPITYDGRRMNSPPPKASNISFEEMAREVENFNPDRFKEFPLWWAKEKFKEKISKANENEKEELVKLFYKLIRGKITVEKYHNELNSISHQL